MTNAIRLQLYNLFEKDSNKWNTTTMRWNGVPVISSEPNWQKKDIPADYILLRYDITNTGKVFGDGVVKLRKSDCDILIVSLGEDSDKLSELESEVERILDLNGVYYFKNNLGYDEKTKQSSISFSMTLRG